MRSNITFRRAEYSDVKSIAQLMIGMGFSHSAEEISRRWGLVEDHEQDLAILAVDRGAPVGMVALHIAPLLFYPKPLARITTLVVDQLRRRQGIGRALVDEALLLAQESGCETIELTTGLERKEAHAFYRSVGFENSALRMSYKL
ncbi:GNAT family N-acetyltransferase [Lacimonas salitolerans]|uniref:GNAT family N-acetyltransferase n=1 Tax=Lacimonas salitolerans TaxID=1323750 RepID=A0ABW4EDT8_9RHOB